ncbi:MAG TPA: transposase [Verrucomicrobiae bacterium]|nr:transposase [Verrucomicrobiae bacterium]
MARKLRLQYPGALYHVMNRGDRSERIFKDYHDRTTFMRTLGEACTKTGWRIHAWCLMPNHFHLVFETPQPNLVAGMKWMLGTYTARFNHRHDYAGHLFSGRYKALIVDGSGDGYLKTVCDYVHLNPARAKLLRPQDKLGDFVWSSLPYYLEAPRKRPAWLRVRPLLGEHSIPFDSAAGRREFGRRMELRRQTEDQPGEFQSLKRGWYLGDRKFRRELLAQMKQLAKEHHYGKDRAETEMEHAESVVKDGLKKLGWTESNLGAVRKGDPRKIKLAVRLRAETTATIKWIAERLQMGSWTYVNHLLYWRRQKFK